MMDPVVIVGGGLAGLAVAHRLQRVGVAVRLLEARLGGRILSLDATGAPAPDGFDLGLSWFWPETQPALGALVAKLGLAAFAQHGEGDLIVQRTPRGAPQRYRLPTPHAPVSMRLAGGTGALRGLSARPNAASGTSPRLSRRSAGGSAGDEGRAVDLTAAAGGRGRRRVRRDGLLGAVPALDRRRRGALLVHSVPIWATLFAWVLRGTRSTATGFAAPVRGLGGLGVLLGAGDARRGQTAGRRPSARGSAEQA